MDNQKKSFAMGIGVGIIVILVLGGVYMAGRQSGGGVKLANTNAVGTQPTNPQPTAPTLPSADGSRIAAVSDSDHIRGNKSAKVTMIEYSDFQCPFCARFAPTVTQVLDEYDGDVRVVYRHFPLRSIHPDAQKAAEASECASEQGKFWEMHDRLFELNSAGTLSLATIKQAATDIGLNTGTFNTCLDSGKYVDVVEQDYQDGLAGGVSGTPGTFINGQYVAGALPFAQIQPIIEAQLNS